jgi:ABC-type nickel/cobalt efflux system permease component RcnA
MAYVRRGGRGERYKVVNGESNNSQPRARPAVSGATREPVMLEAAHLYLEGTAAAVIMAVFGVISGVATLAWSDDERHALLAAAAAFILTGIVLTVRLWRMTRAPAPPAEPPV